jgi:hypothetical protein
MRGMRNQPGHSRKPVKLPPQVVATKITKKVELNTSTHPLHDVAVYVSPQRKRDFPEIDFLEIFLLPVRFLGSSCLPRFFFGGRPELYLFVSLGEVMSVCWQYHSNVI